LGFLDDSIISHLITIISARTKSCIAIPHCIIARIAEPHAILAILIDRHCRRRIYRSSCTGAGPTGWTGLIPHPKSELSSALVDLPA